MIKSMTGYGCSEGICGSTAYKAEIRSVNHKYCDITIRLPESLTRLDQKIRSHISKKFSRGKFDIFLTKMDTSFNRAVPVPDTEAINRYQTMLKELSKHFKVNFSLRKEIGITDLAALRDMMLSGITEVDKPDLDSAIMKIVGKSVDNLMEMRLKEGELIYKDLIKRINRLRLLINSIEKRVPAVIRDMKRRYTDRVMEISGALQLDMNRLDQEIAIMIERMDITEEIVRVGSHIAQLRERLDNGAVVGRSIDFLLQEVNREVNTIASKASDVTIAQIVVDMKTEIERVREQVQNVE
ncbi:MAG TPA: YicC/YloC family endoribonuclease [Nitrospirota bacterium]